MVRAKRADHGRPTGLAATEVYRRVSRSPTRPDPARPDYLPRTVRGRRKAGLWDTPPIWAWFEGPLVLDDHRLAGGLVTPLQIPLEPPTGCSASSSTRSIPSRSLNTSTVSSSHGVRCRRPHGRDLAGRHRRQSAQEGFDLPQQSWHYPSGRDGPLRPPRWPRPTRRRSRSRARATPGDSPSTSALPREGHRPDPFRVRPVVGSGGGADVLSAAVAGARGGELVGRGSPCGGPRRPIPGPRS